VSADVIAGLREVMGQFSGVELRLELLLRVFGLVECRWEGEGGRR
jgi:hypothetical protein